MQVYIDELSHKTKLAATLIFEKNKLKKFFSRTNQMTALKLWMQHCYTSITKVIQMMTLGCREGFYGEIKYGKRV